MRYTADKARFGREMVEACGRLKERIDKQSIVIMEQLNTALTSAADGRAYSFDATTGKISANPQTPDLVTGYINTEEVVRELEALVRDIPREIETLFHTLDESHAEFVGIMNGEPETATRRTFAEVPKVESKPLDTIAGGTPSPIKTSLEAALLASADRTAFLKELVEASNRLKKQIDEKVVSLLMMMKSALATGVDDIAFTQNESTDAITPVPQSDPVAGFATLERTAHEFANAVESMPEEIRLLIQTLFDADQEFTRIISNGLNKGSATK